MKRPLIKTLLAFLAVFLVLFVPGTVRGEGQTFKEIFPDPAFRKEVAGLLEKGESDVLTPGDVALLTNLVLPNKNIQSVEGIGRLTSLGYIDLRGNALREFPLEACQLTKLKILQLDDNQLEKLPKEIGQLTGLTVLSAGGNALSELPKEIGTLDQLEQLQLRRNRLAALPDALGDLSSLKILILEENQLTKVPDSLSRLHSLNILDLGSNRLTALPASLAKLGSLYFTDLSKNAVTDIDQAAWLSLSQKKGTFLYGQNAQLEGSSKGLVGMDYKLDALDLYALDLGCQTAFVLVGPDGLETPFQPEIAGGRLTVPGALLPSPGQYVLKATVSGGVANLFGDTRNGTEGSVVRQGFQVEKVGLLPGIVYGNGVLLAGMAFTAGLLVIVAARMIRSGRGW